MTTVGVRRARVRVVSLVSAGLLAAVARPARAQSVVVSVPNTDVTPRGVAMLAHESQVNAWSGRSVYWNSFTFATYGVGRGVGVAATLYCIGHPPSGNVTLALGYKHRIPLARDSPWEPALAFGPMFPMSFSGQGLGVRAYGVGSFRVPSLRTRFSAGPSYGTRQIFGDLTLCMLAAVEQPLSRRVHLIADWFSGRHDLGALVAAIQINVSKAFIVIAGVKVPGSERAGPTAGLVELTYELGH